MNTKFVKLLIIANIPSPYRVTLFDQLGIIFKDMFSVIYCIENITNLPWKLTNLKHIHYILKKTEVNLWIKTFAFHTGTWQHLRKIKPEIIVTGGFKPPMLIAMLYAKIYQKKHFITTDAWEHTEKTYSFFHKLIRKIVYKYADAFLPVSDKGALNFGKYGVDRTKIFKVPYCIDNSKYYPNQRGKEYDIMFCGQFVDRKMPLFFCEVAKKIKESIGTVSVLLLGMGPLENEVKLLLEKAGILFSMQGFVQQDAISIFYQKSKIFLFPTKSDGWGLVANEACAAGTPVITCEYSGAAGDLIIHNFNGFVLPLEIDIWAEHVVKLLADKKLYDTFSKNALERVQQYSIENAANGVKQAINFVCENEK